MQADPRDKLVQAMFEAISDKGLAATTIADVVRIARVSKRTFYEHFAGKEDCFLASYVAASEENLAVIAAAAGPELPWEAQVRAGVRAYLEHLDSRRALTRTYLLEIHAAGPDAVRVRRAAHDRYAELLRALVAAARVQHPELRPLSPSMAIAVVGGIHELVLVALEAGPERRLGHLAGAAAALLQAVVSAPAPMRATLARRA